MADKQGRGRPKGSTNKSPFIHVPLGELVEALQANYKVPVRASWAKEVLGLEEEDEQVTRKVPREVGDEDTDDDNDYVGGGVKIIDPKDL